MDYRHYIECTWFGRPILRVNEWFLDGHARLELPIGVVADQPKVDQAANLNLWGEAVWFPSTLLIDPRVQWQAIDLVTARLTVPFRDDRENSIATFDSHTGLLQSLESWRYRSASDPTKLAERFDVQEWRTFSRMRIPSRWTLTWLDQGAPWLSVNIEEAVYNVDVSEYIRASGI